MKTKKYQGETEEKVIEMAREELGKEAIVLSIKKITPTGIFSVIKKPYIELVASYDETKIKIDERKNVSASKQKLEEKKLEETENYLESAMKSLSKIGNAKEKNVYENHLLQFIYDVLIEQGVLPQICNEILDGIDLKGNEDIDFIVKIVYNKILNILKESNLAKNEMETKKTGKFAKNIVFLGTTGVGKTTTIAKLSSNLIMQNKLKIGFITADTYRIAAVDQLKVYAEILGSEVEVIYSPSEVSEKIKNLNIINDLIFFDTAGRSHKNEENMMEIENLIKNLQSLHLFLQKLMKQAL